MRAVSNVVAAIVLIGITIVGFAIAYPIFFAKARGVEGAGSILDLESHGKGVKLSLIDYTVTESGGNYNVKLWIYNAGWTTAHLLKVSTPNGYTAQVSVAINPGETSEISLSIPSSYGIPNRIIVVTETRIFIFDLK